MTEVEEKPVNAKMIRDKFHAYITRSLTHHVNALKPEALFNDIVADIRKNKDSLTQQLIGVSNQWGKIEIDHCNGRTTAIDAAMTAAYKDELMKIVHEEVDAQLVQIRGQKDHPVRKAIRKAFAEQAGSYRITHMTEKAASSVLTEIVEMEKEAFRKSMMEETP